MVPLLPSVMRAPVPWMTGQINSYHGMHIKPPFYFEARGRCRLRPAIRFRRFG